MAPGVGSLPAAAGPEPAPDRVDPVAHLEPLLAALPRRAVLALKLGLRVFEWLPFPWRFSRASLEARQDFLREIEASPSATKRDLALFLKVLTGLGYGNDPRVQAAVGYRASCAVAPEARPPVSDAGALGDLEPVGAGEDCDVVIDRLRRRGRGRRDRARRGRARRRRARGRSAHRPRRLPGGAARGADRALPRRRADGRPRPPRDPDPGRPGRGRHDRDQLGHLLPHPRAGARAVGRRAWDRLGRAPRRRLRGGRGDARRARRSTRSGWVATASCCARAPTPSASATRRCAATPAPASSAARARSAAVSTPSGPCTSPTSPGRSPPGPACEPGSRRGASCSTAPRATGVECRAGVASAGGGSRPFTVRARRAVVLAGGAFGTPELLMRSGFRSPGGELGRNLRIHPACWVGAALRRSRSAAGRA